MAESTKNAIKKDKVRQRELKVNYSRALTEFMANKIQEGMTVKDICKTYAGQVPAEKTVYDWKRKYPEFKKAIDTAYQDWMFRKIDELDELSQELMRISKEPSEDDKSSINNKRLYAEGLRQRIGALQFIISKIAPKLVPDLRDATSSAILIPSNVQIINYADVKEDPKLIK